MTALGIFLAMIITLYIIRRIYAKRCLNNLDVALSMSASTATEGDELYLFEILQNKKWLPLPWVNVKFQIDRELEFADNENAVVSDLYYRNDLFHILMHQKITRRLKFVCSKRGYFHIRGLEITAWDILMSNKYIAHFQTNSQLTVYPATLPVTLVDDLCTRVYGYLKSTARIYQDPFSFRGIREYIPGDPMKAVNFKASARSNDLMVNIWDYSNARRIVLLLDVERHTRWHNESLDERAIKIVASLAERLDAEGMPIAYITNAQSIKDKPESSDVPYENTSVLAKRTHRIPPAQAQIPVNAQNHHFAISEGRGPHHLRAILESLAYIDLNNQQLSHFAHILNEIRHTGDFEPEYWFVSCYFDKELEQAFFDLQAAGAKVCWMMPSPRLSEDEITAEVLFV